MPSLKHLVLYDTPVSDETVHFLRQKMHVVAKAADEIPGNEFSTPAPSSGANFEKLIEEIQRSIRESAKDAERIDK